MCDILLKFSYLPPNTTGGFSVNYDSKLPGFYVKDLTSDMSNCLMKTNDFILEIDGQSIALMQSVRECIEKIKDILKINGCILTLLEIKDYNSYIKSNYILDSCLNPKVAMMYKEAENKFNGRRNSYTISKTNFRVYNLIMPIDTTTELKINKLNRNKATRASIGGSMDLSTSSDNTTYKNRDSCGNLINNHSVISVASNGKKRMSANTFQLKAELFDAM